MIGWIVMISPLAGPPEFSSAGLLITVKSGELRCWFELVLTSQIQIKLRSLWLLSSKVSWELPGKARRLGFYRAHSATQRPVDTCF